MCTGRAPTKMSDWFAAQVEKRKLEHKQPMSLAHPAVPTELVDLVKSAAHSREDYKKAKRMFVYLIDLSKTTQSFEKYIEGLTRLGEKYPMFNDIMLRFNWNAPVRLENWEPSDDLGKGVRFIVYDGEPDTYIPPYENDYITHKDIARIIDAGYDIYRAYAYEIPSELTPHVELTDFKILARRGTEPNPEIKWRVATSWTPYVRPVVVKTDGSMKASGCKMWDLEDEWEMWYDTYEEAHAATKYKIEFVPEKHPGPSSYVITARGFVDGKYVPAHEWVPIPFLE